MRPFSSYTLPKRLYSFGGILIAIGSVIIFFHPLLFSGKTLFFRDLHGFFYPMKYHLSSFLVEGRLPFWCSNIFCGAPFLSDIQSGVFYPPALIAFLLPFPGSLNAYVLLHFLLGFWFFYLFIRVRGGSRGAAILTAVSFCFGGYTISSVNTLNNLSTAVWLPAMLWSYHKAVAENDRSKYFLTVVFVAFCILAGEPQLCIISVTLLVLYGTFVVPETDWDPKSASMRFLFLSVLIAGAVILTVIQLGPTYLDYKNSARAGGISLGQATRFSLDIPTLKHLIWPLTFTSGFTTEAGVGGTFFPGDSGIPWLLTIYPGFLILPLACLGAIGRFSRDHMFWLLVFLLSLLMAFGDGTPLFSLFYKIFPFFRYPVKFMFPAGFGLLLLASIGVDTLARFLKSKSIAFRPLMAFLVLVLSTDLYLAHRYLNPVCDAGFYRQIHTDLQPILSDDGLFRVYVASKSPPNPGNRSIRATHAYWQAVIRPNLGILRGISHVGGEAGLELNYQYLITELLLKSWAEKIPFLRISNVKYIVSTANLNETPQVGEHVEKVGPLVYRLKDSMPRAWMVGHLLPVKGDILGILTEPAIDFRGTAFAAENPARSFKKPFFKAVDGIEYVRDDLIRVEVEPEEPMVLVLSESLYPGWRVRVDGRDMPLLRVNLLFQGVAVEEGRHVVEFSFRPFRFRLFSAVSVVSLILFCFGWVFWLFRDNALQKEDPFGTRERRRKTL